jgi:hypothetical protein
MELAERALAGAALAGGPHAELVALGRYLTEREF